MDYLKASLNMSEGTDAKALLTNLFTLGGAPVRTIMQARNQKNKDSITSEQHDAIRRKIESKKRPQSKDVDLLKKENMDLADMIKSLIEHHQEVSKNHCDQVSMMEEEISLLQEKINLLTNQLHMTRDVVQNRRK